MKASRELLEAIAVTAELVGAELSRGAAKAIADELARYPQGWVAGALKRCQRELTSGRLLLAEILKRLDDGRPGVEEAWAACPRSESVTSVWTEEMAQAWGVAAALLAEGDKVAARMAFKEAYLAAVQKARDATLPVRWWVSLGHDPHGREAPLIEAMRQGKLDGEYVFGLLPYRNEPDAAIEGLTTGALKQLT